MKRLRMTVALVAAAVLLAGCGEISNTLKPQAGTADTITVALNAPANFSQVGIFEAQALGYFKQTDLDVHFITPASPLQAIQDGSAQIALASEPAILLARNRHIALAGVAALLQTPAKVTVSCASPTSGRSGATGTGTTTSATQAHTGTGTTAAASTTSSTPRAHPPLRARRCRATTTAQPDPSYAKAPTYNGLNFVVTEHEIINNAPVLRRFIQAVGRGYAAVRAHPESATANLVKLHPNLDYPTQLAGVRASLPNFFPSVQPGQSTAREWGWQTVSAWNRFGTWLLDHHIITNVNATPDADSNELLAGQGV